MAFENRIDQPGGSRRAVREGVMLPAAMMNTTDSTSVDLLEDLLDRFHLDTVPSPSGVTHLLFWRR